MKKKKCKKKKIKINGVKTQIVRKLKNSIGDKTQKLKLLKKKGRKNFYCNKTQNHKYWQKSESSNCEN